MKLCGVFRLRNLLLTRTWSVCVMFGLEWFCLQFCFLGGLQRAHKYVYMPLDPTVVNSTRVFMLSDLSSMLLPCYFCYMVVMVSCIGCSLVYVVVVYLLSGVTYPLFMTARS